MTPDRASAIAELVIPSLILTSIQWLSFDHFLRIHRHQIPQEHRSGRSKRLMKRDGRKVNGQTSMELNTSLYSLYELRHICMAWVEARSGINDTDDGS